MTPTPTIAIRFAAPAEAGIIRRLAALDDGPPPAGRTLLGVVDGEVQAALSLDDGRVVADPFRRTADLVALLMLRGSLLTGPDGLGSGRPHPSSEGPNRPGSRRPDRSPRRVLRRLRPGTEAGLHVPGF